MNKRKNIPKFKSEDEEREFWGKTNFSEYIEWDKTKQISFAKLKPLPEVVKKFKKST